MYDCHLFDYEEVVALDCPHGLHGLLTGGAARPQGPKPKGILKPFDAKTIRISNDYE